MTHKELIKKHFDNFYTGFCTGALVIWWLIWLANCLHTNMADCSKSIEKDTGKKVTITLENK